MSGDALVGRVAKAVVTAVNGQQEGQVASAIGELEELLSHKDVEELGTSLLSSLQESLKGIVEGGSEWEEEVASVKLAILFKLLQNLVCSLVKSGLRLALGPLGTSPFDPFGACAIRLGEVQVDVGRRLDLSDALLGFLKDLSVYDDNFQARNELLAQALTQFGEAVPQKFFWQVNARLCSDQPGGRWRGAGGILAGSAGQRALAVREGRYERMYALRVLSQYCTKQSPGMHEVTATPLLSSLIEAIMSRGSAAGKVAKGTAAAGGGRDKEGARGGGKSVTFAEQLEEDKAGGGDGAGAMECELDGDDAEAMATELAILTMFLPQLGPKLTTQIDSLLALLVHVLSIDLTPLADSTEAATSPGRRDAPSSPHPAPTASPSSSTDRSQPQPPRRAASGHGAPPDSTGGAAPEAEPGAEEVGIPRGVSPEQADGWRGAVHEYLRHVCGLFPCHFLHCLREAAGENAWLVERLDEPLKQLRMTGRLLLSLEAEKDAEKWRGVHVTGLVDHDTQLHSSSLSPKQVLAQLALMSDASHFHPAANAPPPEERQGQGQRGPEPAFAAGGGDPSMEAGGAHAAAVHYHQRQATLLSSEVLWERYMRQQACEQLRDWQRRGTARRIEADKLHALHNALARLQDQVRHLQEDLHRERQTVNNLEKAKMEWGALLKGSINKHKVEQQRMVEQLRQLEATTLELKEENAQLMRDVSDRDRTIVRLRTDVRKLAGAKAEQDEVRASLEAFGKDVLDRGNMDLQLANLKRTLALREAELRKVSAERHAMEEQQGRRQAGLSELEEQVRVREEEAQRLRSQLDVAKSQLQLQNTVNGDKVRLIERKYEEARRLNHVLLARNPAESAELLAPAPMDAPIAAAEADSQAP